MATSMFKKALCLLFPLVGALNGFATGCATTSTEELGDEHVGATDQALTAAQCSYFDINGKVQICHKTSSTTKPYTILRLSEQGCINGHVAHGGDYVTSTDPNSPLYDPTCKGGGCLPVSAPCDATLPCCDGSSCVNGTCQGTPPDPCDGVTCVATDQCHTVGTCDSTTGACSSPAAADGTACDDFNGCTTTDACSAGACTGSVDPCQNSSECRPNGSGYNCTCSPGWTGPNCDTVIDECESNPCVNGNCTDMVNDYMCSCLPGFTGTNCDVPDAPATCPCSGDPTWIAAMNATGASCDARVVIDWGTLWADAGNGGSCGSGTSFDEWGDPNIGAGTWRNTTVAENAACLAEVQASVCNAPPPPPPTCPCPVLNPGAWNGALNTVNSCNDISDGRYAWAEDVPVAYSFDGACYAQDPYTGNSVYLTGLTSGDVAACVALISPHCP